MYPFLNYIMLTVVLRALREGNINYCEAMGFTHDEMNLIENYQYPNLLVSAFYPHHLSILVFDMIFYDNFSYYPAMKADVMNS